MIKKTLIYALVLFLLYNLLLYFWNPSFISTQGFWQDNQIKAQDYIYASDSRMPENIIVGSSMSAMIVTDSLDNFYNLAFLGESHLNGLDLIKEKEWYPKRVFIETNFTSDALNEGLFYEILHNPVTYSLRKYLPALRDGKQPVVLVGSQLENYILKRNFTEEERLDRYSFVFQRFVEPSPGVGVFAGFDTPSSQTSLECLDAFVKDLEDHGVEIYFFEMPYYHTLYHSPRVESMRDLFQQIYPSGKYNYLPRPAYGEYETIDGLHLGREEALRYTIFFRNQVDSLKRIGK